MKNKIRKSEQLPKYGTIVRSKFVSVMEKLPGYKEGIEKGFPLFTAKELEDIKKQYEKDGLTWEEIDKIISGKGIFLKKATFRKYIQDGNLSEAIGYRNEKKSRVAIFPADTIAHINFIQFFYKVIDRSVADQILQIVQDYQVTYQDAIEHVHGKGIFQSVIEYVVYMNDEVLDAFREALGNKPEDRDEILRMLEDICDEYEKYVMPKIDKLMDLLETETMSFSESMKEGKENMWKRKRLEFMSSVEAGLPSMMKFFSEKKSKINNETEVSKAETNGETDKNE